MLCVLPSVNQTCLGTNKIVSGCEKLLNARKYIESTSTFWQQNLFMLRALLVQENFAKGDVLLVYGVTFRL